MSGCPVCLAEMTRDYLQAGSLRLVQCLGCGLVAVAEFTEDAAAYQGNDYFVEKNRYLEQWDDFCAHFDTLLAKILRYKNSGRLLDVGCGVGCLVRRALEWGFAAQGVEFSPWASAFAREQQDLDVVTGLLADAGYGSDTFDVVVINHVLEHVPDPAALLREARRVLKDDGLLVVGVPNAGGIMARLAGARWASLRPEEHRWHFSPGNLKMLLKKEGFRLIHFEARENHAVVGWNLRAMARRAINAFSFITSQGEAMLAFALKNDRGAP